MLLVLVALSAGCVDYYLGVMEETACDNVDPSTVNPEWDRSHCFKDAADRKNTPETCAKIEESAPKTKCYMGLAEELKNPGLCDNLQNQPSGQDYSRLECLQRAAAAMKDPRVCNLMGDATYGGFVQTYSKQECLRIVNASLASDPKAGFDPTDPDSGIGGAF